MNEKKRYWIKLEKNFLKSSHIKIIKTMEMALSISYFILLLCLRARRLSGI